MGIFSFVGSSKTEKRTTPMIIQCDADEVSINDVKIQFPTNYTTLKKILGDASRIETIGQNNNKVYLWDELGIYCSAVDPEKMLMLILVTDNKYGLGHQPTKNFAGSIYIDGKPIEQSIQNVDIARPYMIRSIIKENKQVAVALGWNPGV